MAAITLNIGGNTRQLDRDIQKTVNKVYNINLKSKGDQPLGRITGKVNEFNKSLDASNARVIAFGASAGIIFGVERAFTALVSSTIEVQKSLQDINVILNVSAQSLQKFGGELFNIARNTGQSFQEVAKAATEFSRQGLGVEETLKRTNEALILSRLSGLDTAKSVEALTAAVNSFASQAVTATEVVNKFANVDAAFAVSSADLAEALARVGSSAAQSGVSLNELIAIVTSAQQTTARGGAVIGNSFKTIFTRLQREKVVDLLESLGISGTDSSGQVKSTIQLLQDLGAVYDTLGSQQQAYVAEQVGGVFQINILKAALADLGKEYSIYSSALNVAAGATDQAIRRNEELNKTYAAQINALAENARQLAAAGGERLLGPSIDRLVGGTNTLLKGFSESDGQGVGAVLGKGILDGLGQFIAGPGLALIGGVLLKLFRDLAKFATGSVKELLGLNTAATQQRDLQQSINQILAKNPQLLELALKGEQGLNQAANSLLASLQKQTVELQKQAAVAQQISKAFIAQAGVRVAGGVPVVPTPKTGRPGKAAGYVPNFVATGGVSKRDAFAETIAAYQAGYEPKGVGIVDGKVYNKAESVVQFPGARDRGIVPPKDSLAGKQYQKDFKKTAGYDPYEYMEKGMAKGFIPNFARTGFAIGGITATEPNPAKIKKVSDKQEDGLENQAKSLIAKYTSKYTNSLQPLGRSVSPAEIEQGFNTIAGAKGALNGIIGSIFEVGISTALDYKAAAREKGGDFDVRGGTNLKKVQDLFNVTVPLADFKVNASPGNIKSFIDKILNEEGAGKFEDTEIIRNSQQIAKRELKAIDEKEATRLGIVDQNGKPVPGKEWFPKGTGRGYELKQKIPNISTDVRNRIQKLYDDRITESRGRFGYLGTENYKNIQTQGTPQRLGKGGTGEAGQPKAASYWASKYGYLVPPLAQPGAGTPIFYSPKTKNAARGYIPNFAALSNAISRERSAGVPSSKIYVAQDSRLAAAGYNPFGLGVFNTRDEPTAGARSAAIKSRGYAGGYIPNFAIEDPDAQGASPETATAAIISAISGVAFAFAFTGNQFKDSLKELTAANQQAGRVQREISAKQKREFFDEEKRLRGRAGAETRANERAQQAQFAPGRGAKTGAFFRSNALGLSIAAPILGETIKNAVGQETAGARQFGAVASGAGQIGSFAATGALIAKGGGPIGLAIGALLTIPGIVNEFTTEMPELAAAAKKASQDLTKFSDVSQRLLTASSSLSEFTDKGASPEKLKKVQDDFAKALAELTPAERARIESSIKVGNLEEELAKITQERIDQERLRSQAVSIRSIEERKGALGLFPAGFDPNTAQGRIDEETIRSVFKGFLTGKTPEETLENFNKAAKSGVPQLEELIKTVGTLTKAQQIYSSGSLEQFRGILESIIPKGNTPDEQDFRSRFIKDLVEIADEGDIKALQNILQIPIKSLTRDRQQLEEGIQSAKRAAESTAVFNKVKEKYTGIIDSSISSLNRTIATFNALANALDQFQVNEKSFEREQGVSGLGLRKNIAETVLGPEAELTRRAALFEKIAQNEAVRLDAIDQSNLTFRQNFRDNLKDVFTERAGEIATTKGQTATTIPEQARVANEVLRAVKLFESGAVDINKILEDSFKDGAIDPDQFKTALGAAFQDAEFKTPATNKILDSILSVATKELEASRLDINQRASQANKRAAQEFANEKILLDIRRSLQVFGGIDQFLTPPEEGIVKPLETLIKSATGQLQSQRGFEFARRTGAGTSFGTEKQVQNNIALGQSALNFIKQLQDLSGGAFTPDPGSELFRRAVAGLTQSFESNIKQLNDVLKDPKVDPAFKSQIQATLDAIGGLGSGREIAQLQIAQETGTAFQSTLGGTLSRLQDPAIQQLRTAGLNELADEVARSAQYTSNPIVNVLNVQRSIQVGIAAQLKEITKLLNKPSGPTPSQRVSPPIEDTPTNAKGFIPAFNKERAAISRGVGGAKAGDRPQFIPNLNGSPAFVNSGERLVDNFMGSGQTAVLTRDMQKGMAKGFIPNFAPDPEEKNGSFGRNIGLEDFSSFFIENITTLAKAGKFDITEIFTSGGLGVFAGAGSQYYLDLIRGGQSSENPYVEAIEKFISRGLGGAAGGAISTRTPQGAIIGAMTDLASGAVFDLSTLGGLSWDLILQNIENSKARENIKKLEDQLKLKQNLRKSGNFSVKKKSKYTAKETPESLKKLKQDLESQRSKPKNFASGFIPNFAENLPIDDYLQELARTGGISAASLGMMKTNNPSGLVDIIKGFWAKLSTSSSKNMAKGFIPNFAPDERIEAIDDIPIKGKVVQDLDDTKKGYIIIRSETPLDESFVGREILFGSGKQTGKIISIDPYDRFSARVGGLDGPKGFLPPVKDNPFAIALKPKQKENLTVEELTKKLDQYQEKYEEAFRFTIPGNGEGTPADAADILKGLQRNFEFDSQKYNNIDNTQYRRIKESVKTLRDKIREANNPRSKTRDEVISEAIVDSTTEPVVARMDPENLLTDATTRAAKVTSTIGKYTGLNVSDKPFGEAGDLPTTSLLPQKNPLGSTAQTIDNEVEYYGRPDIGTVFNEAVAINQNFPNEGHIGVLQKAKEAIEKSGGPKAYIERLKKLADFIEQQNKQASESEKFVEIVTLDENKRFKGSFPGSEYTDPRAFGDVNTRVFKTSEFSWLEKAASDRDLNPIKYILERASTLTDVLSEGIVSGAIKAEELGVLGIPLDIANNIVAETIAIDKQLKEQKPFQPSTQKPVTPTVPKTPTPLPPAPIPGIQPAVQDTTPTITVRKPRKPPVVAPVAKPETPFRIIGGQGDRPATQIDASGAGVPVPKGGRVNYPGGISPETARAIVQELDATYNEAIRNQRNPQIAKSWAQTQQRYRLLYSQGKYEELDRFYKGLQKGPNYNNNYGQGTGRRGESVQRFANGFIPNFAQDYISNLAGLESSLSGEKARLTNIPGIGLAMINEDQPDGKFPSKDHPEGKMAAIRNSMKMQKSMGVMNKGYIPNFAATDQSFAKQEAAFNNNTSALTSLAGGIESLNSTLANFEANFANLNNVPGAQPAAGTQQAGAQPQVLTNTNAPVSVIVNPQGGPDIASAIGEEIKTKIPEIVQKVMLAMGYKVPPTLPNT